MNIHKNARTPNRRSPDCRKAPSGRNAALHSRRRIHSRRRRCFTRDRQEMERPNASCRPPCGNGPTPNHPIIDPNGPPHCCLSSPIIIIIGLTSASTEDPLSQGSPSTTYRDRTASARPDRGLETKSPAKPPGFRPWRNGVQAACSMSASSASPSSVLPRRGPFCSCVSITFNNSVSVSFCTTRISRAIRSSAVS